MGEEMITLEFGDITDLRVDAIVNSANSKLIRGSGVCGAIHRAAGPMLEKECLALGGCKTGEAKITHGYNLISKYVIHTVGPVYNGNQENSAELLASCYLRCLELADSYKLKSVAFPCISTGIYGYPKREAARIAVDTAKAFQKHSKIKVIFCCYDEEDFGYYREFTRTQ